MKHKGIIIASTIAVFVLATVLSFVWLFTVRHLSVSVVAITTEEKATYDYANGVLEENYGGKSFFAINVEEIEKKLAENPYIKVNKVKKVFPDRIEVSVERRIERFALVSDDSTCYITDSEYVLLRRETDESLIGEKIIKMSLNGIDLDQSTLKEGSKIGYENDRLVGYMTTIFAGFTDGLNMMDGVTVKGKENRIIFNTKTGVTVEFRFAPSNPTLGEEQVRREEQALVAKVGEVENYYLSLSEKEQRSGSVLVFTKTDGAITIYHTAD
ncbi:MAG: FtsQ-type POTRA domain-containing protein [Clostridiales bacterium]|nr:FtsQ-type POTRA domain-containing protein [Clostridiales bacterium]